MNAHDNDTNHRNIATRLRRISPTISSSSCNAVTSASRRDHVVVIRHSSAGVVVRNGNDTTDTSIILRNSALNNAPPCTNITATDNLPSQRTTTGNSSSSSTTRSGHFQNSITVPVTKYIMVAVITIVVSMMVAILTMLSMLDQQQKFHLITDKFGPPMFHIPPTADNTGIARHPKEKTQLRVMTTNFTAVMHQTFNEFRGSNNVHEPLTLNHWVLCDLTWHPPHHSTTEYWEAPSRRHLCTTTASDSTNPAETTTKHPHAEIVYQFYNPLPHTKRYVCEERIPIDGNFTMTIASSQCTIRHLPISNVFAVPPMEFVTLNGTWKNVPSLNNGSDATPIVLQFTDTTTDFLSFEPCDIPCWYDGAPDGVVSDRYVTHLPDGSTWDILFSMEGPQYYSHLYVDNANHWSNDQFYSTTSYNSDIPLPYYSRTEFHIWHNDFVPFDAGIKGGAFLARNCGSKNNRELLIEDMINSVFTLTELSNSSSSVFRIDSLSDCLHNAAVPSNIDLDDKNAIMKQYLFYFAFENQCVDDYITEKLWGPLEAGTIPVYYGAPNIKDHVPKNSIINVDDFTTTRELMEHLIHVANNRTVYESYHAWRTQPMPDYFRTKYEIAETHSTCRTCRWAYARIHGIGWNHTTQELRPLQNVGSRQPCLMTSTNLVEHPFVEEWVNKNGNVVSVEPIQLQGNTSEIDAPSSEECRRPLLDRNRHVDIDHGTVQRSIYYHDGVVDMMIQHSEEMRSEQSPLQLCLKTPALNAPVVLRQVREEGVWHVQDTVTRYTIAITAPNSHNVTVQYDSDNEYIYMDDVIWMTSIRIFVEDIDTFHMGAELVESYFGTIMTDDFYHPIQMSRHSDRSPPNASMTAQQL